MRQTTKNASGCTARRRLRQVFSFLSAVNSNFDGIHGANNSCRRNAARAWNGSGSAAKSSLSIEKANFLPGEAILDSC